MNEHQSGLICPFCLSECPDKFFHCFNCIGISIRYEIDNLELSKRSYYLSILERHSVMGAEYELTKEKFGYYPDMLAPRSEQRVVAKCEFCLKPFETQINILDGESGPIACKKCNSISTSYAYFHSTENKHEFYLKCTINTDFSKIDIETTKLIYGYDPHSLSHYSSKKIIAFCDYCKCQIHMCMSKFTEKMERISCRGCMRKKTVETLNRKYGVSTTLDIPSVGYKLKNPSTERVIEDILKSRYNVDFKRNYSIGPYLFDFYIPSVDLLIECQGDYFHKFTEFGYAGTPSDRAKSAYVENNFKHKLIWIYEHEIHLGRTTQILDQHLQRVQELNIEFDMKDLKFVNIENQIAHNFLSQYHYLGNLGAIATSWGACFSDILIAVCVFGGATYNQTIKYINESLKTNFGPKDMRELRRFCIYPNIHVEGLTDYLIENFVKLQENIKLVIGFSDPSNEAVESAFSALGWQQMPNIEGTYHYIDPKTNKIVHRKAAFKSAFDDGITESELAAKIGLVRVDKILKHQWVKLF